MAVSRINEAGLNVNQYGNRNLVINGAMQVAQRGTSSTGLGASSGYYTCDRWRMNFNTSGRLTMTQETITDLPGFANCIKLACTTADTSIASGENVFLQHRFEGQNLQQLQKGTSTAKKVTLSFYVKGNASATYTAELRDQDNTRFNGQEFSVTTSWTRVSLTYAGDTTGTFDDDNANSLTLGFFLHAGSSYTGGTFSSNTWHTTTNQRAGDNQTSFFDSTSRTFFITGVQLEVGDTATDFEHRTYGDELLQCQRYYQEMNIVNYPIQAYLAADHYSQMRFSPPLRAAATGSLVSTAIYFTGFDRSSGITATGTGGYKDGLTLRVQGASGVNIGEAGLIVCTGKFDAEL